MNHDLKRFAWFVTLEVNYYHSSSTSNEKYWPTLALTCPAKMKFVHEIILIKPHFPDQYIFEFPLRGEQEV